jgi:hypothetical protein
MDITWSYLFSVPYEPKFAASFSPTNYYGLKLSAKSLQKDTIYYFKVDAKSGQYYGSSYFSLALNSPTKKATTVTNTTGVSLANLNAISFNDSCSGNLAPIVIVSGIVLLGLFSAIAFAFGLFDKKLVEPETEKRVTDNADRKTHPVDAEEMVPVKMLSEPNSKSTDRTTSEAVAKAKSSFGTLVFESHCTVGLFMQSAGRHRWMKAAILTGTLAVEMAFIGIRYEWKNADGSDYSQEEIWTGYGSEDFMYCLSGLGVGLAVGGMLTALFTVVSKLKSVKRRIALAISISVVAVVVSAAVAGAIYTDLNLCYESGGRWAVSFIPTLGGEVLVCQTLVALARAGVLRLLD